MSIPPDQVEAFVGYLRSARSVMIGTHLNPDGDAIGSALALSHFLDSIGTYNEVLCNNLAPRNLEFLPGVERVRLEPSGVPFDLAIVVDLDALHRLGKVQPYFEAMETLVVIDHHVPHEAPGCLRIVDVESPATALILMKLLKAAGATLTPDIATCLLTGIVTDTGSFRFRNTTAESLTASAELLEDGADIVKISEQIYQTKPLTAVRILGRMLDHLQLSSDQRIAWSHLSLADYTETEATEEDAEGLANEMLSIDTVQIAMIIREPKPGKIRCSLRSRGDWDVATIARQFGGGGHHNAAGCNFETTLSDAVAKLVTAAGRCLASS